MDLECEWHLVEGVLERVVKVDLGMYMRGASLGDICLST